MRKNLLISKRNPFFLHACLFWCIGIIQQIKPLTHVVATDGDELMLLSLLTWKHISRIEYALFT